MKLMTQIDVPYRNSMMKEYDEIVLLETSQAKKKLVEQLYIELNNRGLVKHSVVNDPRKGCHNITLTVDINLDSHEKENPGKTIILPGDPLEKVVYIEEKRGELDVKEVLQHFKNIPKEEIHY